MKKGLLLTQDLNVPNQLIGSPHPYAYDLWKKGAANNWMPTEINMSKDAEQWKGGFLSEDEKFLIKRCLGFFAGTESLVGDNLVAISRFLTDGACRQYLKRQAWEESLHNATVEVCCETFSLKQSEVAEAYRSIPSIKAKDDFLMEIASDLNRPDFTTATDAGKQEFLRNLITYYIICEGTFFYSGFAMLLSLGRQNKVPGVTDQIRFTLRDESLHIQFGIYVITTIQKQYPEIWTKEFQEETVAHVKKAVDLEVAYAKDVLPRGLLGLSADMFVDYMKFIANRRLAAINIDFQFDSDKNPFPWLSEQVDTSAQTNFFERRVREYQQPGVLEDDF